MRPLSRKGLVLVVSGPSGVGKGTVIRHLMPMCPHLRESVSYTTREPRGDEVDGKDYFFVSVKDFERRKTAGDFLEWAVVHRDQSYGTSRAQVRQALARGHDVVLEIDCQGAEQVRREWRDAVLVFMAPPSWAELVRRLRGRDTEDEAEVQKRIDSAFREIAELCKYDYLIVNEDSRRSAAELAAIVTGEGLRMSRADCEGLRERLLTEGRARRKQAEA